ncbi:sensor histidine kinase [Spiribacter insolitus]|uniref:histidine kinase n=1 Tax=Spiribacter insolitus TaxID=3122417 RepID=A0ABV3T608_9GAMM
MSEKPVSPGIWHLAVPIEGIDDRAIFIINSTGHIESASHPARDLMDDSASRVTTLHAIFPGIPEKIFRELSQPAALDVTLDHDGLRFWALQCGDDQFWIECEDIAGEKALEDELSRLRRLVKQMEELAPLGDLVSQVSHELNTPLGVCITSASHLSDKIAGLETSFARGELTQRQMQAFLHAAGEAARLVDSNLARAAKIINGLRSFSKDARRHEREKLWLHAYILDIIEQLKPLLEKRNVDVLVNIPKDIVVFESPSVLSQIVSNLVVNSLRHGFSQRVDARPARIEIEATANIGMVEVLYTDNGTGIPQGMVETLFDPFVSGSDDPASTGLGMSIVRELVENRLNGTIKLEQPAVGARFVFTMRRHG